MLDMRPGCECCDKDLPASSGDAFICSFECTFCAECTHRLGFICPNCSGDLVARPNRSEDKLAKNPASTVRIYRPKGCDPKTSSK